MNFQEICARYERHFGGLQNLTRQVVWLAADEGIRAQRFAEGCHPSLAAPLLDLSARKDLGRCLIPCFPNLGKTVFFFVRNFRLAFQGEFRNACNAGNLSRFFSDLIPGPSSRSEGR